MHKTKNRTVPSSFLEKFKQPAHSYPTHFPSGNYKKLQIILCKCTFQISIRGPAQPIFRRRINIVSTLWNNVERWSDVENETKSDVGFSPFHNVDTTSVSDVETTLIQRCATSNQRCFDVVQRCFNVDYNLISTFFQHGLDVI